MKREMRGRWVSSDERLAMGAKLGRYISIRPLLNTSVISSSISIILLGAMIKTKAQQPHAVDGRCADHGRLVVSPAGMHRVWQLATWKPWRNGSECSKPRAPTHELRREGRQM